METIEFWGIGFRSAIHLGWFQGTLIIFTATVVWFLANSIFLRKSITPSVSCVSWKFMALFHIIVSFQAIVFTKGGMDNSATSSVDCIWFNALVSFVYLVLWWSISKFFKKKYQT